MKTVTISSEETRRGSSKEQIEAVKCLFKKWKEEKKKRTHLDLLAKGRTGQLPSPFCPPERASCKLPSLLLGVVSNSEVLVSEPSDNRIYKHYLFPFSHSQETNKTIQREVRGRRAAEAQARNV